MENKDDGHEKSFNNATEMKRKENKKRIEEK